MAAIPTYHYPQHGRLTVLGAGESGVGAAVLARKMGVEVWVSDRGQIADNYKRVLLDASIPIEEGTHTESRILAANVAVKSTGIPATAPIAQKLKGQQTPVIAEIEFAAQYTVAKLNGITG